MEQPKPEGKIEHIPAEWKESEQKPEFLRARLLYMYSEFFDALKQSGTDREALNTANELHGMIKNSEKIYKEVSGEDFDLKNEISICLEDENKRFELSGQSEEKNSEEKFIDSLSKYPVGHLQTLERSTTFLLNEAEKSESGTIQIEGMREIDKKGLLKRLDAIREEIKKREKGGAM